MNSHTMIFSVMIVFCSFFVLQPVSAAPAKKTVEQVFKEKANLKGKQVSVTGKIVKVNNGIMQRNFLHLKDGTGAAGSDDLIITSQDTANVGDSVEITGTVKLDTDFGYGYKYPLLIEKSSVKIKK